jgi:hypothetical protein
MADETMLDKAQIDNANRVPLHMQAVKHFDLRLKMESLVGLMLLLLSVGGLSRPQANSQAKSPQSGEVKTETAKAKPGADEMRRLGFYVGEWTYTETYPNGTVNHGTYSSKLGPGGNSLLNTFHSQGPVGDFEGMLVYTWDLAEGKYKAYVFGGDFPGALVETGEFEGEKLVFHGELGAGGAKIQVRNVTWMASPGKLISEQYMSRAGAPEKLLVRVEASKQ